MRTMYVLAMTLMATLPACTRQPAAKPAAPPEPPLQAFASTRQIMLGITIPTSDVVFQVSAKAPADEREWEKVAANAAALAESGNLLMMAPLIVPHVVSAVAYYGFLGRVRLTGTLLGVIVAHGILAVPVAFLVITATLKGFDRNLERAAMSSGAGPLRTFFHVTLPVLRPGMLVGALFAFLSSFNEAVVVIFIGGREASTLPKKMYESIRLESDPVIAVVSTLLVGAVVLGVLLSTFMRRRPANAT